jgi:hypothetical protein
MTAGIAWIAPWLTKRQLLYYRSLSIARDIGDSAKFGHDEVISVDLGRGRSNPMVKLALL